jgi:hypothetical protein
MTIPKRNLPKKTIIEIEKKYNEKYFTKNKDTILKKLKEKRKSEREFLKVTAPNVLKIKDKISNSLKKEYRKNYYKNYRQLNKSSNKK